MSDPSTMLVVELKTAVEGLLYPSESDEPLEPFAWDVKTNQTAEDAVVEHAGGKEPLVEQPINEFFGDLEEADDADRFNAIRTFLAERLTDLHVFRVGSIQLDVYVVGRTGNHWVGLQTLSVET